MTETTTRDLPVSLYMVWQWWERYYQAQRGRPERIDEDWLDAVWLGRQRFLFEQFGRFGLGNEKPSLDDPGYLTQVMPFNCNIVPVAMGMKPKLKPIGGYVSNPLTVDEIKRLRPVDLAQTPVAELIIRERQHRMERYGRATQMIDIASVTNNAFTMRGAEFYLDLIADKPLATHYLSVLTESMGLAYRFVRDQFGPVISQWSGHESVSLGNCNVTMMSPDLYIEMIRPHDIAYVESAARISGKPPCCALHHCNVKTEPFAEAYSRVPGLELLQGSILSDIAAIRRVMPKVNFSAMVNPAHLLSEPAEKIADGLDAAIKAGASDLAVWDIDPEYGPDSIATFLEMVERTAGRYGRRAVYSAIPFSWEELDWEFPHYRPEYA
jgi:hypothetical protein